MADYGFIYHKKTLETAELILPLFQDLLRFEKPLLPAINL